MFVLFVLNLIKNGSSKNAVTANTLLTIYTVMTVVWGNTLNKIMSAIVHTARRISSKSHIPFRDTRKLFLQ